MSFEGAESGRVGEVLDFLIDLQEPLQDLVLVRVRIEWTSPNEAGARRFGASFLDSSKGWLASGEDTVH
jgi:hypothetical protein